MSLLEVRGLKKSFGSAEILKGIDLRVEKGERIAIIGGSGCGKSVFLRCLTLLEKPTAGQIFVIHPSRRLHDPRIARRLRKRNAARRGG